MRFRALSASLVFSMMTACSGEVFEFSPEAAVNKLTAETQLRLASRSFVASTLNDVFGPSAATHVQTLVTNQISAFAGEPCDNYNATNCGDLTQLPVVATASTQRAALLIRACRRIVNDDRAVTFAAAQAGAGSPLATPTDSQIDAAFQLFYLGKPLPNDLHTELKGVVQAAVQQGLNATDQWRFLWDLLCGTPYWQVP